MVFTSVYGRVVCRETRLLAFFFYPQPSFLPSGHGAESANCHAGPRAPPHPSSVATHQHRAIQGTCVQVWPQGERDPWAPVPGSGDPSHRSPHLHAQIHISATSVPGSGDPPPTHPVYTPKLASLPPRPGSPETRTPYRWLEHQRPKPGNLPVCGASTLLRQHRNAPFPPKGL